MRVKFLSLASGSSGNCYYLEANNKAILIDAGIPKRAITNKLKESGMSIEKVMGLFITHDHSDHVRTAGVIGEHLHIPVYATKAVHIGLQQKAKHYDLSPALTPVSIRNVEYDVAKVLSGTPFKVTPFKVPHDCTDNVGYYIEVGSEGEEPVKFCLVTDCCCFVDNQVDPMKILEARNCGVLDDYLWSEFTEISANIKKYLRKADHIVIESNHDLYMLEHGRYPKKLQDRVRGVDKLYRRPGGHLNNEECAHLLDDIYHDSIKHVFLCHLSQDNNTPEKAYECSEKVLLSKGVKIASAEDPDGVVLKPLNRTDSTGPYIFENGQLSLDFEDSQLTLDFE